VIYTNRIILLVEDNDADVELARMAFERSGIPNEIVVASNGERALDYLFATGGQADRDPTATPRVILLDINLPGISGLEVLRRVRADERTKRLPVVILTTSTEGKDVIDSYNLGCNSYVRKPVDFIEFAEAARQLGRYWLRLNEPPPSPGN